MSVNSEKRPKVVVAMSGGVDSSVAAAILLEEGYDIIGVTMQVWPRVSCAEKQFDKACCSIEAIDDARRVADRLGFPHYVLNFRDTFQEMVIDNFIEEYRRGRTPNPCVRCNRFVKFESLLTKARGLGAEYVATGHYSRVVYDDSIDRWRLKRGLDNSKDQSYALYSMSQYQLAHTLMPLGTMAKDDVRALAAKLGLNVAAKPDSQEICFVENKDYPGFLKQHVPEVAKPGPILDMDGKVLGQHNGIAFYTIGQRKRLGISAKEPHYVVRIDTEKNAIIVGRNDDLYTKGLIATDLNYILFKSLNSSVAVTAKIRYNMKDSPALLTNVVEGQAQVIFDQPQRAITPGQAAVFYQGDDVVGGGTIDRILE